MRRNTRNLRPFIGKTISGVIETFQDEEEGRIQIQFTDGSAVEFQADANNETPWLNVDPVETERVLPPPGFEQGARVPTQAYDDEWIGGTSTEAGNPVQDCDLPPGAETAEYNKVREVPPAIKKLLGE